MIIQTIFKKKSSLFIPFIMAGHPTPKETVSAILALSEVGADIIELGVPFSDPVADGPVNQAAAHLALQQGVTIISILEIIAEVRMLGCSTPIIIFSYLNPILSMGYHEFAKQAAQAGANAVLIVDLPPEEGMDFYKILAQHHLECVILTSPTTRAERLELLKQPNLGFVYYISRKSVTGTQTNLSASLKEELQLLRAHLPHIPIAVGFGISTPEQAAYVSKLADGVIVGSVLVKTLEEKGMKQFKGLAQTFAETIHGTASDE